MRGEVGTDDGVLVIRRVRVTYRLQADEEHRDTVERVHDLHADKCPVYRTLRNSIEVTTEYHMKPAEA